MRYFWILVFAAASYAQTTVVGGASGGLSTTTFASPPASPTVNAAYLFTDAGATGTCSGGGTSYAVCIWSGASWTAIAGTSTGLGDPGSNGVVFRNASGTSIPSTATQMSGPNFCSDAGSTDTYACNLSPVIASYATGTLYWFKANTLNTGTATINFNGKGALTIKKRHGGVSSNLETGDILAGDWIAGVYDGTNFQMATTPGTMLDQSFLDTDGTLTANSDSKIATQKATKTYADTKVPQTTTVNGHALSANVTVTTTDLSLNNVTNDAQTKAAIVPNTAPAAGRILVGNAGGTAYAPVAMSGSCTLASTGAITCTGSGTVTVASSGSLTDTGCVTGNGTTVIQTASGCTIDSSGNISTPGSITTGSSSGVAGALELGQGTAPSAGTTSIKLYAPASVTSYIRKLGAVAATGIYRGNNSAGVVTDSQAELSGAVTTSGSNVTTLAPASSLGTDNSVAGTLQMANGSSNAHTIWGSGATTTNTVLGPATVPMTGHLLECSTSSTTCTLHDSGVVTANAVNASSPGPGIAHFAGSTQTVTSSTIATADIANNAVTSAQEAVVNTRRVCDIGFGNTNASSVLADADLGPQKGICFIPYAATVVEIDVIADAGTPNIIIGVNHAGSVTNLVSGALATASSGARACSKTTNVAGLDGTTCSATLQNTGVAVGDYIEAVSGTAGGTAKWMSVHVVYTVN